MKSKISLLLIACMVSACGIETASTAATAAALKQKELEAGRKTMQEAEKQIGQSMDQLEKSAAKAGETDK